MHQQSDSESAAAQALDEASLDAYLSGGGPPEALLCLAVRANRSDSLRRLLRAGASPDALDATCGEAPLHACAAAGLTECASALLAAGADPNLPSAAGDLPLHLAAASTERSAAATIRELLQAGADPEKRDASGDNALHVACFMENSRTVELLLRQRPAMVNARNGGGSSGLHIAAACENHELLGLLLCHGADFSLADCHGKTTVDLLLEGPDTSGIDTLGRHIMRRLRRFNSGQQPLSVLESAEGHEFVRQLLLVEGVTAGHAAPTWPTRSEAERRSRLARLEAAVSRRKVDPDRLICELIAAFQAGLVCDLQSGDLMDRIAWQVCQLVLFAQNMPLLHRLTHHRQLWTVVSCHLEAKIDRLYARTLRKQKAGVRELLRRKCSDASGQSVSFVKLNKLVAQLTAYWQFAGRPLMFEPTEQRDTWCQKRPLRDPLQSLVLWAIFSGRPKLVPTLLRQEEFDLVPLALLATTLLRALARRRDTEDVFVDKAGRIADICEGMAIQVIKQVKEVDNSPGNCLTISYVSLPLPNFANYNILDLSARGGAGEFIKLDIVELATEKGWYGDFFSFRSAFLREFVIVSGFVPPCMLFLPALLRRFRGPGSRNFLESVLNESTLAEHHGNCPEALRLLAKDNDACLEQHDALLEERRRQLCHRMREFGKEMLLFYNTPCVKFRLHAVSAFIFIGLLSYMILNDFQGGASAIEVFCYCTLFGVLVEEVREITSARRKETLGSYLKDGWNGIDLIAIASGFLAFVARQLDTQHMDVLGTLGEHGKSWGDISYIFIVITALIFWIRILYISIVLESVGVKLKMLTLIIKKDFIPFLYILFVIMIGFGTTFHALLWPNAKYFSQGRFNDIAAAEVLEEMFRRTFYTIVGEYGLEDMKKECDSPAWGNNSQQAYDPAVVADKCVDFPGNVLVPYVLMVLYIVIVQVLLLNVIVAMFSKTVDMVDADSKSLWLFERYDLTKEFSKRSPLPSPFNILLEARNLLSWLVSKLGRCVIRRAPSRSLLEVLSQNTMNFVYLFYLYYQSVTLRRLRRKLDGLRTEEDDFGPEGAALLKRIAEVREATDELRDLVLGAGCGRQRGGAGGQQRVPGPTEPQPEPPRDGHSVWSFGDGSLSEF